MNELDYEPAEVEGGLYLFIRFLLGRVPNKYLLQRRKKLNKKRKKQEVAEGLLGQGEAVHHEGVRLRGLEGRRERMAMRKEKTKMREARKGQKEVKEKREAKNHEGNARKEKRKRNRTRKEKGMKGTRTKRGKLMSKRTGSPSTRMMCRRTPLHS
jgi:hypothetical protein